nr:MAG TPA: hypothetical protein [Caudoviricetes sp.]
MPFMATKGSIISLILKLQAIQTFLYLGSIPDSERRLNDYNKIKKKR